MCNVITKLRKTLKSEVYMKILKTEYLYEGCKLELVDVDSHYEIRINGEVKATEFDYYRALETFRSFEN